MGKRGKTVMLTVGLVAALVMAHILSVPVPPDFKNPWILRVSIGAYKLYIWLHDLVEYIWDVEFRFLFFKMTFVPPPAPPNVWGIHVQTIDTYFDGVEVRVYTPGNIVTEAPAILFFHGGGWFFGSIRMYDAFCRSLSDATQTVVVSVEYRLGPDHRYPIPVEDCERASKYLLLHARQYGVDAKRIALLGDSAGGNLAAAVALKLRDQKFAVQPRLQVLVYPALQAMDMRTPSYQMNTHDPMLNPRMMAGFWLLYATGTISNLDFMVQNNHTTPEAKQNVSLSYMNHGHLPAESIQDGYTPNRIDHGDGEMWSTLKEFFLDPYFAPLMSPNVSDLPETFLLTMENDILRDDGFWYAQRLEESGNRITHIHYKSGFHGLVSYPIPFMEDCKIATGKLHSFLRERL